MHHYQLISDLMGNWTGSPPNNYVYQGPYLYPFAPALYCCAIESVVPLGKGIAVQSIPTMGLGVIYNLFKTTHAVVTAIFSRPPWQPATSGGYFRVTFGAGGEFLTIPETSYQFSDGTPTNSPLGIFMPQAEITVTRYRAPFVPDQVMMPILGMLNDAPFTILNNTYNTGTLLFMAGNSEVESDPLGNITYQYEYKFMYRPIDWNKYLHPTRGQGFQYVNDGAGNMPYQYTSLEVLP